MNSAKFRFVLDLHSAQSQVSIPALVGDTSRTLYISFTDGGLPYVIADGCLAKISIKRPSGTKYEDFCAIKDNSTVVFAFSKNVCSVSGIYNCDVVLYGTNEEVIASARFIIVASERVIAKDDVIITDEDYTAIDAILSAEAARQHAEASRVNAEAERITAEQGRETSEATRAAAEEARVASEIQRVEAEEERLAIGKVASDAADRAEQSALNAEKHAKEAQDTLESYVKKDDSTSNGGAFVYTNDAKTKHYLGNANASYTAYNIPMIFGSAGGTSAPAGGYLLTSVPANPYHCANKKYVDDNFSSKQGAEMLGKRVEQLEASAEGKLYTSMTETFEALMGDSFQNWGNGGWWTQNHGNNSYETYLPLAILNTLTLDAETAVPSVLFDYPISAELKAQMEAKKAEVSEYYNGNAVFNFVTRRVSINYTKSTYYDSPTPTADDISYWDNGDGTYTFQFYQGGYPEGVTFYLDYPYVNGVELSDYNYWEEYGELWVSLTFSCSSETEAEAIKNAIPDSVGHWDISVFAEETVSTMEVMQTDVTDEPFITLWQASDVQNHWDYGDYIEVRSKIGACSPDKITITAMRRI